MPPLEVNDVPILFRNPWTRRGWDGLSRLAGSQRSPSNYPAGGMMEGISSRIRMKVQMLRSSTRNSDGCPPHPPCALGGFRHSFL
jgi:hypothetical protein